MEQNRQEELKLRQKKYKDQDDVTSNLEIKKSNGQTKSEEKEVTSKEEIHEIFSIYARDGVRFFIVDGDGFKYYDNALVKVTESTVTIQNPFLTYANKKFPNAVKGGYESEGVEYSFILRKSKEINNYIECVIPDKIRVLQKRESARVSTRKDNKIAVGLYVRGKDKELIGQMIDISKVGIGISFQDAILDSETLNFLTELNEPLPIIIDDNGKYFTTSVIVKHTFQNRNENKINIGAEFLEVLNFENPEHKQLCSFFNKTKEEYENEKIRTKTEHLILSSKMGISF